MRSSSLIALHYIVEAGSSFGGGTTTPSGLSPTATSGKSASTGKKKVSPLVDPDVMGPGGMPEFATRAIETIATGPRRLFNLGGDKAGEAFLATSAAGLAAKQAANLPQTFKREQEAQQEGIRGMTNVSNFYKGIGAQPIPLHSPGELGLLQTVLKNLAGGGKSP